MKLNLIYDRIYLFVLLYFIRDDRGPEFSIFVGDLGPEVTEWMLVVCQITLS
jgi:hypothetical protein